MSKPLVLIIEDDKNSAILYGRIVESMGYNFQIIPEKQAALWRLDEVKPHLVILEMRLSKGRGDILGAEIISKIRFNKRLKDTRVIVVTSSSKLAIEVEDEADGVIIKPISVKKLIDLIEEVK